MYRIFFSTFSISLSHSLLSCFLSSSSLFFCRFVVLSHFGNVCAQSGAAPPLAAGPPAPEMKCLRAVNLSDSRRKGSATGGRAGQGRGEQLQHVAWRGVAWRGGVVQSIYRHVHSLQVCAAVATPAGMADYVPPRVPASLLATSGSLAPTWPLTTSKSAKCQVFALVSSPATYIPCAAAPHTPFSPPPPTLPPPSPCFTACFCWRFLPPNFGAVTFFSALSLPHSAASSSSSSL